MNKEDFILELKHWIREFNYVPWSEDGMDIIEDILEEVHYAITTDYPEAVLTTVYESGTNICFYYKKTPDVVGLDRWMIGLNKENWMIKIGDYSVPTMFNWE